MEEIEGFVLDGSRAYYRPVGSVSFKQAISLVRAAIGAARANGVRELLVDTTALTDFHSPSKAERFFAVEEWAEEARGVVRMGMVLRPDLIDSRKFGVTVGVNRGLQSNVFPTEEEARAWLDARP